MSSSLLDCWKEAEMPGYWNLAERNNDVEDQAFLRRIVSIDETWIMDFEPELKSQSNEWRGRPYGFCSAKKNFDELNQRSSKWSLLRIIKDSSWQIESHVEEVSLECIIVLSCKNFAEKCTRTDLSCSWLGNSFSMTMIARNQNTSQSWVANVTSCALQSRHESTRLRLIPKVKKTYAWMMCFFSGRAF